jgi:hypothetical protein
MGIEKQLIPAPGFNTAHAGVLLTHDVQSAHWYALYTTARHEKVVARQLEERKVETFLPLYRAWHRW